MTVAEAAEYTGLPSRRIYELVARAKAGSASASRIPFVPIEGRIYFRETSLDSWVEGLEVVAMSGR